MQSNLTVVDRVCLQCGTIFHVPPSQLNHRACLFCGTKCSGIYRSRSASDRFWAMVRKGSDGECWPWIGTKDKKGYGRFKAGNNIPSRAASRVAWQFTNGPIPDGLWVLHRCDNPACCNPSHLFLGTSNDNIADMVAKRRSTRLEKNPAAKLNMDLAEEIRRMHAAGLMTIKSLADQFGVTHNAIYQVIHNITWKKEHRHD